jgi:hypothetical protein
MPRKTILMEKLSENIKISLGRYMAGIISVSGEFWA